MDDGSRKRALDIDGPSQTWLKTKKLKESGLVYKEGKFSAEEKQKLRDAVLYYRDAHGLSDEDIQLLIYKRRNATTKEQKDRMAEHKGFWKEIASTLPDRTVESQYRAVQREFDVQNKKGKWTEDEDTVLRTLVVTMSKNWVEIAAQIGRTASGCADRWKVLERLDQEKNSGKWTPDEELLYKNAFESLVAQGRVPDVKDKEFWEEIAVHVGTRTYVQCRQKWNRQTGVIPADMQPAEAPVLEKVARWNYASDDILLVKLDELVAQGVQHESEIEWRTLRDDALPWAQGKIHDAFNRLRSKVEDSTSKTFPEIVEGIREYIQIRTEKRAKRTPARPRKKNHLSTSLVNDEEDDWDQQVEQVQQAHTEEEGYYEGEDGAHEYQDAHGDLIEEVELDFGQTEGMPLHGSDNEQFLHGVGEDLPQDSADEAGAIKKKKSSKKKRDEETPEERKQRRKEKKLRKLALEKAED